MNDQEAEAEREQRGKETPEDRLQRERVGVAGDPVPDHEYGDRSEPEQHAVEAVDECATCGVQGVEGVVDTRDGAVLPECLPCRHARVLAACGLLTARQAEAYAYRSLHGIARQETADRLGISVNVLDKHLAAAREKVDTARATAEALARLEREQTER